jgi:hypothetical protein
MELCSHYALACCSKVAVAISGPLSPRTYLEHLFRGGLRVRVHQSCAVDLVGLDACNRAAGGLGAEGTKPVRGLIGGVHSFLVLPQAHREQLPALRVTEEQAADVTGLHPECRDDVVFDRVTPLLQALGVYGELGYPR